MDKNIGDRKIRRFREMWANHSYLSNHEGHEEHEGKNFSLMRLDHERKGDLQV